MGTKLITQKERERSSRRLRKYMSSIQPDFREAFQNMEEREAAAWERQVGVGWYGRVSTTEQDWRPFAPMPQVLCRLSPFFPMNPRQLENRYVFRNAEVQREVGDTITYRGPQLSVYEEDVLVPLLGLLNNGVHRVENKMFDPAGYRPTFSYQGPLRPIMRLMGLPSGTGRYQRVIRSLELMTRAGIELKGGGGREKIENIIVEFDLDPESKEVTVTPHPFFYQTFCHGEVTLLDVVQRAGLSRPVTKALYRLIMSRPSRRWDPHYTHLIQPLNLDPRLPSTLVRTYLKAAVAELQKKGILDPASGFKSRNNLHLAWYRTTRGRCE